MEESQLSIEYLAMTDRQELYAKFGIACEASQLFETELGTLLLSLRGMNNEWHSRSDPLAASKCLDEINRSTMGQLLHKVRGILTIEGDPEEIFMSALVSRNRLMHGFFEQHNFKIQSEAGRSHMIGDLDRLHQEVFDAWQLASQISSVMVQAMQLAAKVGTSEVSAVSDDDLTQWTGPAVKLEAADLRAAAAVVIEGGAIKGTVEQVSARLANAHWVTLLRETCSKRIVGVAALKNPAAHYRLKTFGNAKFSIDGFEAASELGYVAVAIDKRGAGLSRLLVEGIVSEIQSPVYATTDNKRMISKLGGAGFCRVGSEWHGRRGRLSLWTMVPSLVPDRAEVPKSTLVT